MNHGVTYYVKLSDIVWFVGPDNTTSRYHEQTTNAATFLVEVNNQHIDE